MTASVQLIVGLGNPGAEYELTRHNVGVWFLEALAAKYDGLLHSESKFRGQLGSVAINGKHRKLFFPTTYMNLSGQAVRAVVDFYKIDIESILVVHDELDFLPGMARLKLGGGANGHNGLQSIIAHLGGENFYRLRLGIGKPRHKDLVVDYVLGKPSADDKKQILIAIDRSIAIMPDLINGNMQQAMQLLHGHS